VEKRADVDVDFVEERCKEAGAKAAVDAEKAKQAVKMELVNRILTKYID
jgi:hypothetical protein